MKIDFMGIAAVVAVLGTPLTVIFAQFNTRKAIRDARNQAARDAAAHAETLAVQDEVLARVKENTDGLLTTAKNVADKLGAEVERVAAGGQPTPYGVPSAEHPVTLSAGQAIVARPDRAAPAPDSATPPKTSAE